MAKYVVACTWENVPHLTPEAIKDLWASIPPHQRDARSKGIPQIGAGKIYPVSELDIVVPRFDIPAKWRKVYGLDVGWNRTAAIWIAEDPVSKVWYAWSEHYMGNMEPSSQALAIKARGATIPGVIDPASRGRSQADGQQLIQTYKDLGLLVTPAKNAVETGLYEVWQALTSGMLKIFPDLQNFLEEYRVYRRDAKGHVVKERDHLMDCCRYVWLSGRDLAISTAIEIIPPQRERGRSYGNTGQGWMGV